MSAGLAAPLADGETPQIFVLDNGVRVIVDPMPGLRTFALTAAVACGARYERPDQGGYAHLLEHMVFKRAGGRSARDLAEAIEMRGGQINAATGYEMTRFQVRATLDALETAFEAVADLIQRPDLDPADLTLERDVVVQEIAEARDDPSDYVFELAQAAAYDGHALGRPILGSVKTVRAATAQRLSDFHQAHYTPERTVISVAGGVGVAEILRLCQAWFGAWTASGRPAAVLTPPEFHSGAVASVRKLEQAQGVWLTPAPAADSEAVYPLYLFTEILGGGMASRLFQQAREERGLAYDISAYYELYADGGLLGVSAGCEAAAAAPLAELVAKTFKALVDAPLPQELTRAKAQIRASLLMGLESPYARAERWAWQASQFGRLNSTDETLHKVDSVRLLDLQNFGAETLLKQKSISAILGPKSAQGAKDVFSQALFS